MPDYIGKCACYFSIGRIRAMPLEEWMKRMKHNFSRVSPHELSEGQVKAWKNSYAVLKTAIESLPDSYNNLYVVFEYVLPQHSPESRHATDDIGIRADAIIVGKNIETVLEFKQKSELYDGDVNQTQKYKTRLQKFHIQSKGMSKKAVLVLTKANEFSKHLRRAEVCSPDRLSDALIYIFGEYPKNRANIDDWINSEFVVR